MHVKRGAGGSDISALVREMTQQLKKMRIIDSQQMREMFLTYDCDRSGYIELEELKRMCRKINLPIDDDVIEALAMECSADSGGRIGFHEFLEFFEN
jgi:Ca2+-binding EF-hand superfamily protein